MAQHRSKTAISVEGGGQIQWDFAEPDSDDDSGPTERWLRRGPVLFKDPDPRKLFVGQQSLEDFLELSRQQGVFILRELLAGLDWSSFESGYLGGGRSPYHPRVMMGLVLLGIMTGRTSLRALEVLARFDVRCWWLTGGVMPDHSAIGKFLDRHGEVLTTKFFDDLTGNIIKSLGSNCSCIAGDGTVIEACSSRFKMLKADAAARAAAEARARAAAEPGNKKLADLADLAQQAADTAKKRSDERRAKKRKNPDAPVCPAEPEAMFQPQKNKTVRPSYKPSALSNEERIITGQTVDPSNESIVVEQMLEQSERISGQQVDELLLDAGYFTALVVLFCYGQDVRLLCPQGKSEPGGVKPKKSEKQIPKNRFTYDEERDEYRCPAGQRLKRLERSKAKDGKYGWVRYRCDACDGCSYKPKCARGKGGRSIKRYDHEELFEAQLQVMQNPQAQKRYSKRQGMIEPIFGELRHIQNLHRFRRRGLAKVRLEFSLHCSAHNVRRFLVLCCRREGLPWLIFVCHSLWRMWVVTVLWAGMSHNRARTTVPCHP